MSFPSHPVAQLGYRKDIDGLRGIAISFVLFYHTGFHFIPSGFVGVDVFFVISGYLISSIIFNHLENNDFSWSEFYRRRIRRLFPALFALYMITSVAAYFILYPKQLAAYGQSLAYSALFAANFYFVRSGGYFAPDADLSPLQHMWSLAVEEQFYLVFPFLALIVFRYARGWRKPLFWAMAFVSFGLNIWLSYEHKDTAFYMLPNRFWELLLGSLIALGAVPQLHCRLWRESVGGLGLVLVILGGVIATRGAAFPGFFVLMPVVGSAMLIHSGASRDTFVYRLLSNAPLVFVGLISYSLYLWHFPILSFYKWVRLIYTLHNNDAMILIPLSVIAALASYYLVERPLRFSMPKLPNSRVFASAAVSLAILLTVAASYWASDGMKFRFTPEVLKYADFEAVKGPGKCFLGFTNVTIDEDCLKPVNDKPNILLFGDSHAAHITTGFQNIFPQVHFLESTAGGCPPTFHRGKMPRCTISEGFVFNDFLPNHKIDGIILAANWQQADISNLIEVIQQLKRYSDNIIVFGPIPEYRNDLPIILANSVRDHDPGLPHRMQDDARFWLDLTMAQAVKPTGAHYISLVEALCPGGDCLRLDDQGLPLQFDYSHLSVPGAEVLGRRLQGQLDPLW